MIEIIDYGSGNIRAIANVYNKLNIPFHIATRPAHLDGATKIVLPGVGAFDHAMERLEESGVRTKLEELVAGPKVAVLGICVGMQILARSSEEGRRAGLGWVNGVVKKFVPASSGELIRLPHMGWNDVIPKAGLGLFQALETDARFYFLHSYYFQCDRQESVIATCNYGDEFACAVRSGNIYGVQFHPEKSHRFGVQLLKNFAEL